MEGRSYYAVDTLFPSVVSFIGNSLGFMERCDLTGRNLFYSETVNELLINHNGEK